MAARLITPGMLHARLQIALPAARIVGDLSKWASDNGHLANPGQQAPYHFKPAVTFRAFVPADNFMGEEEVDVAYSSLEVFENIQGTSDVFVLTFHDPSGTPDDARQAHDLLLAFFRSVEAEVSEPPTKPKAWDFKLNDLYNEMIKSGQTRQDYFEKTYWPRRLEDRDVYSPARRSIRDSLMKNLKRREDRFHREPIPADV